MCYLSSLWELFWITLLRIKQKAETTQRAKTNPLISLTFLSYPRAGVFSTTVQYAG